MYPARAPSRRRPGWTLVELALVLGLLTLLSSLTLPGYLSALREGRRSEALGLLMEIELRQARWQAIRGDYSNNLGSEGLAFDPANAHSTAVLSDSGRYRIELEAVSASGYRLRALGQGSQESDLACRLLVLEQASAQTLRLAGPAPESLSEVGSSASARRCWKL
ncbi:type IV pilin protein [Piscinibacter sp. Jin2]|uniref:Type IV pilin protein n=1 Tax=Aquariibacter lacus TaxID=2801332 RepID=A0A9X1BNS8_9BURK|nr:type IV pilin protein [Piscinibacter lacus]MBL0720407.1 type IV pilin protein [Piscinibacter lacus]